MDLERRIKKYLAEYKENEKTIRRYKVQDMLTFLMAKELLLGGRDHCVSAQAVIDRAGQTLSPETWQRIEKCKLKNISPERRDQESSLLSIPIPFRITLTLKDKNGEEVQRTIHQATLKLKNYGDFFQFIYDDRIRTLLPQVSKVEIDRSELEKELDNYDLKRPGVFALSHQLEEVAFKANPALKDEPYSEQELPKRNNFRALISTLGSMEEEELNKIVHVRNAFSHNHYTDELDLEEADLPAIAQQIWREFERLIDKNK